MTKNLALMAGTALAAAVLPTAASAQQLPPAVIAVVDSDRIFSECTACVAANSQLQAQGQALQTRSQALAAPLETEQQAIAQAVQAAGGNPDAALQQRIQTFRTNQQNAQQEIGQQQQTIQRNIAYVRQQISERLSPIIQQQMQARGANVAMDTAATYAHAQPIDITDSVLTALNAALPSVNVTAPPPPTPPAPAGSTEGR